MCSNYQLLDFKHKSELDCYNLSKFGFTKKRL